jgi:serine/threonine-protein kinase ATR
MAGNFKLLEKHVNNSNKTGFEYQVGEALLALIQGNTTQFQTSIGNAQATLGHAIVATGTDSSRQCYDALARLHALQELKAIRAHMSSEGVERRSFMTQLDERLKIMIPMPKYQQFTLALRRAAMEITKTEYSQICLSNVEYHMENET